MTIFKRKSEEARYGVTSSYPDSESSADEKTNIMKPEVMTGLEPNIVALPPEDNAAMSGTFVSEDGHFRKPIESYEGYHRYDPDFQWTPEEEKRLVRKLDYKICAFVCLCFFALQLDRGNIVQALSDNMLQDLGMNTNDYNTGQTIFYVSFLVAEMPSQLVSKKIGPDNWIPIQMVSWSLIASMQAFLSGKGSFYATRCLLGIMEGGFIPDNILYLSYFYTSKELPGRLSYFWTAYQFTFIIGAFLAFGFLHFGGVNGLAGWRWLFALEGAITGTIGIFTYFYLPPSPTQTKGSIRGKDGWFNEREEKIMVNRILRDDPSKGDMHNRQAVNFRQFGKALLDYDLWPIYLLGLTWMIPPTPLTAYLTLQLKALGFGTFETNLLSIPAYALFIANLLLWTWISEKINQRILLCIVVQFWFLPFLIALEVLPADARWARYAMTICMVGYPYVHAIIVAMVSRNAGSVRTRTVATAIYNMTVQAGNIIAINIYRNDDKPLYKRGNKVLLALVAYNIFGFVGAKLYYVWRNKQKARVWDAMTKQERSEYLASGKDLGNRRLDFRFAH